jgi:hypothetical protein
MHERMQNIEVRGDAVQIRTVRSRFSGLNLQLRPPRNSIAAAPGGSSSAAISSVFGAPTLLRLALQPHISRSHVRHDSCRRRHHPCSGQPNSAPKQCSQKVVSCSDPQRPSAAAAPPDPAQSHFPFLSTGNSYTICKTRRVCKYQNNPTSKGLAQNSTQVMRRQSQHQRPNGGAMHGNRPATRHTSATCHMCLLASSKGFGRNHRAAALRSTSHSQQACWRGMERSARNHDRQTACSLLASPSSIKDQWGRLCGLKARGGGDVCSVLIRSRRQGTGDK